MSHREERVKNLAYEAWLDLQQMQVLWQLGALVIALGIAWLLNRLAHLERIEASGVWKFGAGGFKRILAPVVALIVVAVERELLERRLQISVHVLDLFVALLGSLALVRILFYALGRVFAPGSALQA